MRRFRSDVELAERARPAGHKLHVPCSIRGRWAAVAVAVVVASLAVSAWASFTSTASGTGTGRTGTLGTPTNVAASQPTASVATVQVTWSAVADPGSGTFGYYVQRFSGSTSQPACGSSSTSLITSAGCNDTNVPPGSYTYKVIAAYNSWSATSAGSTAIATTAGSSTSLTVAPSAVTYGNESAERFTATVTGIAGGPTPTGAATIKSGATTLCTTGSLSGAGDQASASCSLTNTQLTVGSYSNITASYGGDTNYTGSASTAQSLTVNRDSTTAGVSETPTAVAYGNESASLFTVTVTTGNHEPLPATEPVTVNVDSTSCVANVAPGSAGGTGTCRITDTAITPSATPYAVTATYPGDTDLSPSTQATSTTGLTVNKDSTTASVSETPTTVTYGAESASTFTVKVTTGFGENLPATEAVTVNVDSTSCVANVAPGSSGGIGTCRIADTAITPSATPYAVTATYAGDADLTASAQATAPTGLTVNKANQTITFTSTPPANATAGGPTYAVSATASSGLTVTFSIDATATSVCSISGSTVSFTAAGTCVIDANQAGNANYNAASQAQQSVTVTASTITYKATGAPTTWTTTVQENVSYPAGTNLSDLLLLVYADSANNNAPGTPSGWTLLASQSGDGATKLTVWWKLASSGETSVSLTPSKLGPSGATAWVIRYARPSGYPPVPAPAGAAVSSTTGNSATTSFTPTMTTTTAANATMISLVDQAQTSSNLSLSPANGFTQEGTTQRSTGVAVAVADQVVAASGTTPTAPTWSSSAGADWAAITVAFS